MTHRCFLITDGAEMPLENLCSDNLKSCCEEQIQEYFKTVGQNKMEMIDWKQENNTIPDAYVKIVPVDYEPIVYAYDFRFVNLR